MTLTAGLDTTGWTTQSFKPYWRGDFPASAAAYTSIKEMSFETGILGNEADGTSGFGDAWANMTYSDDWASQGTKSAKLFYPVGSEGFNSSGSETNITLADTAQYGETFWIKSDVLIPTASDLNTSSGYLKAIRPKPEHPTGVGEGVTEILLADGGTFRASVETESPVIGVNVDGAFTFTKGTSFTMEKSVKLHLTEGFLRFWLNGILAHEILDIKTCEQTDSYMALVWFGSNWNDGAPAVMQSMTGDFVVGDVLSSDGVDGASFATVTYKHSATVYQITVGAYSLAAGDTLTGATSGNSGVLVRAGETQYFDNIVFASSRKGKPIQFDAAGNPYIGTAKVAV